MFNTILIIVYIPLRLWSCRPSRYHQWSCSSPDNLLAAQIGYSFLTNDQSIDDTGFEQPSPSSENSRRFFLFLWLGDLNAERVDCLFSRGFIWNEISTYTWKSSLRSTRRPAELLVASDTHQGPIQFLQPSHRNPMKNTNLVSIGHLAHYWLSSNGDWTWKTLWRWLVTSSGFAQWKITVMCAQSGN